MPNRGVYIELMGHEGEDRELCVKCWTHENDLQALRDRISERIEKGTPRWHRRLGRAAKSATAWSISLRDKRPRGTAALCDGLVGRLLEDPW
jgi:hypothetical protein